MQTTVAPETPPWAVNWSRQVRPRWWAGLLVPR